ncbi:MAG: hypothetical protein AMXMBFR48_14540 [Ignavibacteriales bacterium]
MTINKIRTFLYTAARLLGDVNAVKKGKIGERILRRIAGKAAGKLLNKLPK